MKKYLGIALFSCLIAVVSALNVSAQETMKHDEMMGKDDHMMMAKFNKSLPTVAIVRADWCPYCKNVEPVVMSVKKEYSGKVNFVVFDVTDDAAKAASLENAKKYGLTKFYNDNKDKTSTVAVIKKDKIVYKTSNNTNKEQYSAAIDKAIK